MAEPRKSPFIWATWLSKVMSGDGDCQWGAWFQTHNQLGKQQPDDPALSAWMVDHTRMVTQLQKDLRFGGLKPLPGMDVAIPNLPYGAVVKGKLDCLTNEDSLATVYDCKTGRQKNADTVQVQIYMLALSRMSAFAQKTIRGVVVYKEDRLDVPPISDSFIENFNYFVDLLAGDEEPMKVPSKNDCRFCKITRNDCEERFEGGDAEIEF